MWGKHLVKVCREKKRKVFISDLRDNVKEQLDKLVSQKESIGSINIPQREDRKQTGGNNILTLSN